MARKFSLTKDQWLKMLEKERGIKPVRYAQDIIWPTLALRDAIDPTIAAISTGLIAITVLVVVASQFVTARSGARP